MASRAGRDLGFVAGAASSVRGMVGTMGIPVLPFGLRHAPEGSARERVPGRFLLSLRRAMTRQAAAVADPSAPAVAADAASAEPLDTDLTDNIEAGPRRRRLMWQIAAIAVVVRLCLLPLGHPWDTTTFYNVFLDLGHNRSPYDTMQYLNLIAQAAKWGFDGSYQGYAYPPGTIYLYWPLAHIFTWLHPSLAPHYTVEGRFSVPNIPLDFYFWYKLPIWLADLGIAFLLIRMTGSLRSFRDYLLNPYVLLISGCWTFDSVMVVAMLLGVYWLQRGRVGWSGLALAVGTILKFIPGFIVPTCLLYLIQRKRPVRELGLFLGVYIGACLAMVLPFLQGTLYVVQFQGTRPGVGLVWEMVLHETDVLKGSAMYWQAVNTAVSNYALAGLVIGMLLAYRFVFQHEMPLNRMVLITLLAYLLSTKVVNEQYLLSVLPFSLIELHGVLGRRPAWSAWRPYHVLLWVTPLVFAAFNVPLDRFLIPMYQTLLRTRANILTRIGYTGFTGNELIPWYHLSWREYALDAIALWFVALVIIALLVLGRRRDTGSSGAWLDWLSADLSAPFFALAHTWTSFGRAAESVLWAGRPAPARRHRHQMGRPPRRRPARAAPPNPEEKVPVAPTIRR